MDQEWAKSLVGRDWEIFWDDGGGGYDEGSKAESTQNPAAEDSIAFDGAPENANGFIGSTEEDLHDMVNAIATATSPPLSPGEYDVILPSTEQGLMIDVSPDNGNVAFKQYRRLKDGSKGPAELNNLIRQTGDYIVTVDGVRTAGKKFDEVITMLCTSGKNKYASLRFQSVAVRTEKKTRSGLNCDTDSALMETPTVRASLEISKSTTTPIVDENSNISLGNETENEKRDDEKDITDWYDGRILSFGSAEKGFSFDVQFVGDEEIYTMPLSPSLVRPSAKAWILRTKALLTSCEIEHWELSLPADTSTHEDRDHLEELRQQYQLHEIDNSPNLQSDSHCVSHPTITQFNDTQMLRYFLHAQRYLRTKLAPIVDIGEKDENEPTDTYVNFLTSCLERLSTSCAWYNKCWLLSQCAFSANRSLEKLDVEFLRKGCIEAGREEILSISRTDVLPSGIKKHPAVSTAGTRRTKRRRMHRDPSHFVSSRQVACSTDEDAECFSNLEEGQFFSSRAVERFVNNLKTEDITWFQVYCVGILRSLARDIQEPVASWIWESECMLGERKESYDDQSSTDTSVEDRDEAIGNENGESMEVDETGYTFLAVKVVVDRARSELVLCKFDLSRWTSKLEKKLRLIEEFEREAWKGVSKIADLTNEIQSGCDSVLTALIELKGQLCASDSLLANIVPLGVYPSSKMTKGVIEDSILVRQWVIDLNQAERQRERVAFIQDVAARAPNLPHIPCVPGEPLAEGSLLWKLGKVVARVQHVSTKLFSNVHIITRYERHLAESSDPNTDTEGLRNISGIDKALSALALIPVLSLVEEKLSVRRDLLRWVTTIKQVLDKDPISLSFEETENSFKDLAIILAAKSNGRRRLTEGLMRKEAIEKEVRQFVRNDVDNLSDNAGPRLETLFRQAVSWKERAESVIFALRGYGNTIAGEPLSSSKAVAMVDCKRMADLLHEYDSLDVSIPLLYTRIQAVYTETTNWSQKVNTDIHQEQNLLSYLAGCRNDRPKGVIVDPARHTLDVIIDLLEWHDKVKHNVSVCGAGNRNFLEVYLLTADGVEVVERYARHQIVENKFPFDRAAVIEFVAKASGIHRQTKSPALSKVESTDLGKIVLDRMVSISFDEAEGYPMFSLLYVVWAIAVSQFIARATLATVHGRPSLPDALTIAAQEPTHVGVNTSLLLDDKLSGAVNKLASLIAECTNIELEAKKIVAPDKDVFRGSLEKADSVRAYLASLKQLQLKFKSPKQGVKGLILDADTEKSVDKLAKELSWFVRTLSFPVLHTNTIEVAPCQRIPWAELVSLFERIPTSSECVVGDIPRVVLHVRELHESACMWQKEVSSLLSLSIRGAKRRHAGVQEGESAGKESNSKISNVKLDELVKDPILRIVSIPREGAVREVLNKTREFETMMHNLLVQDFSAVSADKAPYPEASSLVGTNDEFHLYRLTGSPQFSALKACLERISLVSSDIAADTPGKEAFEWIHRCVEWIDSLNCAVTEVSPFGVSDRLVVPVHEASRILMVGNRLFLDISDDVRKTLSSRRIIVSTNKQSAKLTVTIAKGGAHHSTGGTALKWCPLIFDWLKNDIDRHQQWVDKGNAILDKAKVCGANQSDTSQESVNASYQYFDDLNIHLDEGRFSLVVVPEKLMIDRMVSIRKELEDWIQLQVDGTGRLSLKVAKVNRYENAGAAIHERDTFLDSLLVRRRIQASVRREPFSVNASSNGFREKARMKLEKAMKKGMRMMGFRIQGAKDVALHCTMKAWEIESASFSRFRDGEKSVKSGYADKIISIVNNLDAVRNPILCAKVLTNELAIDALLEMTSDEMAGQDLRDKKAKAEAMSKRNIIVAAGKVKSPSQKGKTVKNLLSKVSSATGPPKVPRPLPVLKPATRLQPSQEPISLIIPALNNVNTTRSTSTNSGGFSPPSHGENMTFDPISIASAVQAAQRITSLPPAPPPPLVGYGGGAPQITADHMASSRGDSVKTKNDGDRVTFTIEKQSFEARLINDDDSMPEIDGFLPESMSIIGRLDTERFTRFLSDKLKSGRSVAVVLRLSICDGTDKYKRFYRDFEKRGRIAMFKINEQDKLFLVTPKFHSAAKEIRNKLSSRSHTYAVLIKREFNFHN